MPISSRVFDCILREKLKRYAHLQNSTTEFKMLYLTLLLELSLDRVRVFLFLSTFLMFPAERNKGAILSVLKPRLLRCKTVLEIGSGNGVHIRHFSKEIPEMLWQPSELFENLAILRAAISEERRTNLALPFELDVENGPWPATAYGSVYTANTLHYMSWAAAQLLLQGAAEVLESLGCLCIYGPFNSCGDFTSDGNRRLHSWLKTVNSAFGLRDEEDVIGFAEEKGLVFSEGVDMPANNRMLFFSKVG